MAFSSFKAFLDIAQEPEKADAIFVFAGREERKRLGIELFRAELAPPSHSKRGAVRVEALRSVGTLE